MSSPFLLLYGPWSKIISFSINFYEESQPGSCSFNEPIESKQNLSNVGLAGLLLGHRVLQKIYHFESRFQIERFQTSARNVIRICDKWNIVCCHQRGEVVFGLLPPLSHSPPPNLQFVWNLVKLLVDIKCNTGKNRDKCNQSVLAKGIIMLTDDTSIMTKNNSKKKKMMIMMCDKL